VSPASGAAKPCATVGPGEQLCRKHPVKRRKELLQSKGKKDEVAGIFLLSQLPSRRQKG